MSILLTVLKFIGAVIAIGAIGFCVDFVYEFVIKGFGPWTRRK